ncbi:MAG: SDR family oxidoreductase [Candidatus Pseudobacter hemicellulosilyticus]|uniref:SDR family oxidoreductase n=1 Tax=Candidatus Pseudobacter hemicellulosilyticus TaxID=3121375 RepID=A0AAJ5WP70_9BACT|nr:MAG: SDR family oxidoreductase [Pseudobacter sp.]
MSFFKDKVVVITGGSDGIGRALVDTFIEAGAKVATCGRNYDKLYTLIVRHTNVMLHTMTCDISKESDCRRFIESTIKTFGGIDILINNAGISMRGLFKDTDVDVIRRVMDVNFFGALYCTKFALPSIMERQGVIVGISSVAGYRGLPGRTGYSASKFALQGWMEALRTELLHSGVHVMWVSPGFTTSNIRQVALNSQGEPQGETPLEEGKLMSAHDVSLHILKAVEQRKRTLVLTGTGKSTVFMNRFFPAWADKLVYKFFYKNGELIK